MSTDDSSKKDEPAHPYETEDSFHPMGSEWEEQMREELEETDYDADLGMRMARDAQRLVAGELSEEEFYAEYHDDVKEEFETDERPIFDDLDGVDLDQFEDDGSMLQSLKDVDLEADDVSRRTMMKNMGAAGLFLGYSALATVSDDRDDDEIPERVTGIRPADEDERDHRWGMVIDLERCDGCLACVTGCIDENGTSTGANWMYVFAYESEESEQENFLVRPCQHCSNAPCAKVCPVRARHTRQNDGLVLTNYETCIGCRYCQVACPYGVNYFQWGDPDVPMGAIDHIDKRPSEVREDYDGTRERNEALAEVNDHVYDERGWWVDSRPPKGTMGKCTMCPSRQDGHTHSPKGTVACQDACDETGMSAIHFGDMDAEVGDDFDRAVRYLEDRTEKSEDDGTSKFDANITFTVNDDEPIDFERGYYSLSLVERNGGDWVLLDSTTVGVLEDEDDEALDEVRRPGVPFDPNDRDGSLTDVPDELYRDQATEVGARVAYPDDVDERELALILSDGEDEDTIALEEYTFDEEYTSNTGWDGKLSSFKLLEDLGTEPNITYIGDEPGPNAEQRDDQPYGSLSSEKWDRWMDVKDNRKEHLDYGAGGPPEEDD